MKLLKCIVANAWLSRWFRVSMFVRVLLYFCYTSHNGGKCKVNNIYATRQEVMLYTAPEIKVGVLKVRSSCVDQPSPLASYPKAVVFILFCNERVHLL